MPKKTPTRSKPARRYDVHRSCSKKRTILKDQLRLQGALIDDLQTEIRLITRVLSDHQDLLVTLASELKFELDPFGAIHDPRKTGPDLLLPDDWGEESST